MTGNMELERDADPRQLLLHSNLRETALEWRAVRGEYDGSWIMLVFIQKSRNTLTFNVAGH